MERRLKKKKQVSMELWFYCASLISWNFGIVVRVGCFGGGTDVVLCTTVHPIDALKHIAVLYSSFICIKKCRCEHCVLFGLDAFAPH